MAAIERLAGEYPLDRAAADGRAEDHTAEGASRTAEGRGSTAEGRDRTARRCGAADVGPTGATGRDAVVTGAGDTGVPLLGGTR